MSHIAAIRSMPCVLCEVLGMEQATPTEAHHIRAGQGLAQRASDVLAIPLCVDHHRGKHGVHGDRMALRAAKVDELALLAYTLEQFL
jgi:hypothetical protein